MSVKGASTKADNFFDTIDRSLELTRTSREIIEETKRNMEKCRRLILELRSRLNRESPRLRARNLARKGKTEVSELLRQMTDVKLSNCQRDINACIKRARLKGVKKKQAKPKRPKEGP